VRVQFIGAVGLITRDRAGGRRLYTRALGLPLRQPPGANFVFSRRLPGSRYFGVWPLAEAARTCFGRTAWPRGRTVPQAFIEFEVASPRRVFAAAEELTAGGIALLHPARTDAWGQTVVRFQTDDGLVVGVSYVPWMHAKRRPRRPRARRRR
jgi:catechol 2,3-dioxygenase-like lactoylglutathione lyase family enzyme